MILTTINAIHLILSHRITKDILTVLEKNLLKDERINYMAPADYQEDSEIDEIVKKTIELMALNTKLKNITYKQTNDYCQN